MPIGGINRHNSLTLDYTVPLGERPSQGSSTFFSVMATLSELGKQPIWQGTSTARARHRRALELQPAVITALMNALGETVGVSDF